MEAWSFTFFCKINAVQKLIMFVQTGGSRNIARMQIPAASTDGRHSRDHEKLMYRFGKPDPKLQKVSLELTSLWLL